MQHQVTIKDAKISSLTNRLLYVLANDLGEGRTWRNLSTDKTETLKEFNALSGINLDSVYDIPFHLHSVVGIKAEWDCDYSLKPIATKEAAK